MKDLKEFPVDNHLDQNLCLNEHHLTRDVFRGNFNPARSDKCSGKSRKVASSCSDITKQPLYICPGQGHTVINQKKDLKEQANERTVEGGAENLQVRRQDKKESCRGDRENVKMKKDEMASLCLYSRKICKKKREDDKSEKFDVEGRESNSRNMNEGNVDLTKKLGEQFEKTPQILMLTKEEKKDREKKDKNEINRKNKARQLRIRLDIRKETSPKEVMCDWNVKKTEESEQPKKHVTKRTDYTKNVDDGFGEDERKSFTLDRDHNVDGFGEDERKSFKPDRNTNVDIVESQPNKCIVQQSPSRRSFPESQLTLVVQSVRDHPLCRQKSAEEHIGDLGNLVGELLSLASLPSLKDTTLSTECPFIRKLKTDEKNLIQRDTIYESKEMKEMRGGLKANKEVCRKQETEWSAEKGDVDSDSEINVERLGGSLTKWMTDLQENIELAENKFKEIQNFIGGLEIMLSAWIHKTMVDNQRMCTEYQAAHTTVRVQRKKRSQRTWNEHDVLVCSATDGRILTLTARRGDKSQWIEPMDSEGNNVNSHGGRKSNGDDLSEKENRNYDDEKDRDEKEDPPLNGRGPRKDLFSRSKGINSKNREVDQNYKYRRKTHGQLRNGQAQLSDFLGLLLNLDQNIPPDLMVDIKGFIEDINPCLVICLRKQSDNDLEHCQICSCLTALTSHFGNCNSSYSSEVQKCTLCIQLFRLVQQHVLLCRASDSSTSCPVLVCRKISFLINEDPRLIFTKEGKIWRKLKKYMGGYIQSKKEISETRLEDGGEHYFSMTSLISINPNMVGYGTGSPVNPPPVPKRLSTAYMPSLTIIHEDQQDRSLNLPEKYEPPTPERTSRSEPIVKKLEDGTVVEMSRPKPRPKKPFLRIGSVDRLITHPPSPLVTRPPPSFTIPRTIEQTRPPVEAKVVRKVSFKEKSANKVLDVESDAFPDTSAVAVEREYTSESESQSSISSEPFSLEKTYGQQLKSINEGSHPWPTGIEFHSLKERPTGSPGIGEVVYGHRDVLLEVIKYWEDLRQQYKTFGKLLQKSVKEEGVIYPDCKGKLIIMGHRYQKDFQWVRLVHLGRGMFGNCHLASDYNTEYQFCIKKIHISKYREDEIKIWSDLKHQNIVKFHGALRRKEKIYIISEFISGGNLTDIIKAQKTLMRRLSQKKALQLFHQLLKVLIYLEKKAVIHEDIKSDNILVREDGKEIVLADFGVARRQTSKVSSLVGTPTHFSPEKAESSGHAFKSDLWAAMCVLVHILSGDPPWVKRYPSATAIHFLIATKPAPLEDIPKNIHQELWNLIQTGLEKKPQDRPTAKEMLQHAAFQFINEFGDNLYSVLNSGNTVEDDMRLPSNKQIEPTDEIMEEVEHSLNNQENLEMFDNCVVIQQNITKILGTSMKMEDDVETVLNSVKHEKVSPRHTTEIFSKLHDPDFDKSSKNSKSEHTILESFKKSLLATPKDILSDMTNDFKTLYLNDVNSLNDFPHIDTNLTVLPLFDDIETGIYHPSNNITAEEVEIPPNFSDSLPAFTNLLEGDVEETEIDRLHTRVLNEQLSKTSSTSDLLGVASQSSHLNSGSHGSSEFNQERIIQTLIEENDGRSSSRSGSSTRSDDTSSISRRSSSSAFPDPLMTMLAIPTDSTNNSNSTDNGNLPNSILFDFELTSKSKSSESFHTPVEEIPVEEVPNAASDENVFQALPDKRKGDSGIMDARDHVKPLSRMAAVDPVLPRKKTMFDDDYDIHDDDLFAVNETPSANKSQDFSINKSEGSIKDNTSLNLSGQESSESQGEVVAPGPIMPFTIDPSRQMVVIDTDPRKALPPPMNFKKPNQRKPNLHVNVKNPSKPSKVQYRLSNPDVGLPYTPLTPPKFYTPQVNQPKASFSPLQPKVSTPRSSSPTSQKEQDEEYEKLVRDLSQHSGDPIQELNLETHPSPSKEELQPFLTEEEEYECSLQLVLEKYVNTETNDKSIKVEVLKLDGKQFTTKLSYEYSNKFWKSFVEENFRMMETDGINMLTLCFLDNTPLDLQERPIDCHENYRVFLKVVEVTEHGRDDLLWYCQNSICRSGGGIPV